MLCPKCNGESKVTDSRKAFDDNNSDDVPGRFAFLGDNVVYRRHKCVLCSHNFPSIQILESKLNELEGLTTEKIIEKIRSQ